MRQHVQEGARRRRVAPQAGRHQRQRPRDRRKGVRVQIQVLLVGGCEQGQQLDRIGGEHLRPLDRQSPLVDPEAVDLQLAARRTERGHQARQALRRLLVPRLQLGRHGAGQGADVARDQEIATHEPLHRRLVAASAPAHAPRDLGLHVERQLLLRPPRDQVQMDAHPPQEVEGLVRGPAFARGEQLVHHGRAQPAFRGQRPGDPVQGVQVAQPPLAVLDVGFDLVAGGAGLLVAHGPFFQLGGDEGARVGLGHHVAKPTDHQLGQTLIAGQRSRLQQGGSHRHVGARQRQALLDRARGRPHLHPQVPQDVKDEFDHALAARRGLGRAQEQQVQVRKGRQHAPAVTPHRHQRQPLALDRRDREQGLRRHPPQGRQHLVGGGGVQAGDLAPLQSGVQLALGAGAGGVIGLAQNERDRRARILRGGGLV